MTKPTDYETKVVGSARFTQKELDRLQAAVGYLDGYVIGSGGSENPKYVINELSEIVGAILEQVNRG